MKEQLQLIEVALSDVGYTATTLKMMGNVGDVRTDDGEQVSIVLLERSIKRMHDDYFSLSADGFKSACGCECKWIANIYGNKACSLVALDTYDFESVDEWGDAVYTYANPLANA
jgi:hypothetical protein